MSGVRDLVCGAGLRRRVDRYGSAVAAPTGDRSAVAVTDAVTDADIAGLPVPARRYLRFMNVVDRPRDSWFTVRFAGRFRLRPDQRWMPFVAWQRNCAVPISRVFQLRMWFAHLLPMDGSDVYAAGRGRMRGKLLGLVPVADGSGPEFDVGELATYLNDACLLAPSMLLVPAVTWAPVDDDSFDVTLADAGLSVTGRVWVDEAGQLRDFATTDRFAALPSGPVRARWTTPVAGWDTDAGRRFPVGARAVWHLPGGEFCYVQGRFDPTTLRTGGGAPP